MPQRLTGINIFRAQFLTLIVKFYDYSIINMPLATILELVLIASLAQTEPSPRASCRLQCRRHVSICKFQFHVELMDIDPRSVVGHLRALSQEPLWEEFNLCNFREANS